MLQGLPSSDPRFLSSAYTVLCCAVCTHRRLTRLVDRDGKDGVWYDLHSHKLKCDQWALFGGLGTRSRVLQVARVLESWTRLMLGGVAD